MSNKLILPLLMYKKKKGKESYVVPSWNHLYVIRNNRPILDQYAMKHKDKIICLTKQWIEQNNWIKTVDQKVIVNVYVYWNDARSKDCHNVDKLILDCFNDLIYDDDSNVLLRYMDFDIDIENPRIEIEFIKGGKFNRKERRKELEKEVKENRKNKEV